MAPSLLVFLALTSCKKDKGNPATDSGTSASDALLWADVEQTGEWEIPGMACDVHIVRTQADVPHIYAHDRADLSRAYGFVQARDRFFEMELARRLGRGNISELLGADALENDMESRANGMTWVGENLEGNLTDEQLVLVDAFVEGVNAWIALARSGDMAMPSELEIAGPFLGVSDPVDLLQDWIRADVTAIAAVLVYELGYETGDVGRASTAARLGALYDDSVALHDLREAGVIDDIWTPIIPPKPSTSAAGWEGDPVSLAPPAGAWQGAGKPVPQDMLDRLEQRLDRFEARLGRGDLEAGWGSNVWAVDASVSAAGTSLLASDGHLPLSVPSLFWQIGLDTQTLGGGDLQQVGLGIPGLPILAVGTNGYVAWSQTQLSGDITDWYRDEVQLDANGALGATLFGGEWQPVVAVEESHTIADIPLLDSVGGTYSWTRYTTFDGRWISDVEGVEVDDDYTAAEGETVLVLPGTRILPQDTDGDGVITAVSFAYAGLSDGNILTALDGFGHSKNVDELREATRSLVAYSQNIVAADREGRVYYTGYQAVPCREYLPRNADGSFITGADPGLLIDGTTYGGFQIPFDDAGLPVEGDADPYRCLVPFDEYPSTVDPLQGYVVNANNDPGSITLDGDLFDDPWYIGGPWNEGFRADRIEGLLDDAIAAGNADADAMARIQGDDKSALGAHFSWHLVEAIDNARTASTSGATDGVEARLAALYDQDPDALDEVATRLSAWSERDFLAESGVATFYSTATDEQVADSIATMLFNAWLGYWDDAVFSDEALPHVWKPGSTTGKVRALTTMLDGRGDDNPADLTSWTVESGESAFFDVIGTDEVETADEVALLALHDALAFLRSEPGDELRGSGFGTDDISQYKWGLRHQARFESVLSEFIGGDDFSFLTDTFSINTLVLPLEGGDEVRDLDWFPRPGDNLGVDAANPGWGTDFTHGSGPTFRMVIELGPDGMVSGRNIIPGGQSALIDSPHFTDQAALWLANETVPMHLTPDDVISDAVSRQVLKGSGAACAD